MADVKQSLWYPSGNHTGFGTAAEEAISWGCPLHSIRCVMKTSAYNHFFASGMVTISSQQGNGFFNNSISYNSFPLIMMLATLPSSHHHPSLPTTNHPQGQSTTPLASRRASLGSRRTFLFSNLGMTSKACEQQLTDSGGVNHPGWLNSLVNG